MNNQIVRWGIIGSGRIARAFAEGLGYTQNGRLCAIASRNLEKAEVFAKEWNIPYAFGTYEELAQSDEVTVYIATPHLPTLKTQYFA